MPDSNFKQLERLIILLAEVTILFIVSKIAFGSWLPPIGDKGFWFYAVVLSLLLGSRLITPFYLRPADVIAYTVSAGIALFIVNHWDVWDTKERIFFSVPTIYCFLVGFLAFITIFTKDSDRISLTKLSKSLSNSFDIIGTPRVIFSFLILFSLYVFHRDSAIEMLSIGIAWAITVAASPAETFIILWKKIRELWIIDIPKKIVGLIVAYQSPGIVLIRQKKSEKVNFGTPLLIKDPHAPTKIGLALDYVGRDEGVLLRATEVEVKNIIEDTKEIARGIPDGTVAKIDGNIISGVQNDWENILQGFSSLAGIVAPETTINRLYFEVIKEDDLEEGRLVETFIGKQRVLYQIVGGLTKEEIVYKKNTYGYARAQAQKVGMWVEGDKKFKPVKWLPKLNAPVFLKTDEEFKPVAEAVGHFPKTSYTSGIKDINDLVTHNTAILGILGVGKSMLSIELLERMIAEGIKVICLDLTNQYAEELSVFYDKDWEDKRTRQIQEAGEKDRDKWEENPKEGGSLPAFSKAIFEDLQEFLKTENKRMLKIYNPSKLFATKQINEPKQFKVHGQWDRKAALWTITPVEVTRIISETALELLQGEMVDRARACLVYEEAHSLIPEWNSVASEGDKAATNGSARAILQGRKYGLGCLLVTQRTANVTKTILNQCNTIFAMRSFDETGKDFLSNYIGKDYASILSSLPEREAVFFGKASNCENPVHIRLNDRDKFRGAFRKEHPPPELPEVLEEEPEVIVADNPSEDDIPF
ncbi:MAG: DUF87 domain-containing protein [Deltaproteobacteria bacterium]|nr:DUF87 domain-containing protein [Deltaproteobacteria bacterium]